MTGSGVFTTSTGVGGLLGVPLVRADGALTRASRTTSASGAPMAIGPDLGRAEVTDDIDTDGRIAAG